MSKKLVVIAGGGTGGHIFLGLAVAEAIRALRSDVEVIWLGSRRGHEGRIVPRHDVPIRFVSAARIVGGSPLARAWGFLLVPVGVLQALWLFLVRRPAAVLGVGGYASAAGGVAARVLGIPLIIAEQNALPGRTNRKLGRFARKIAIAFEEARSFFPKERCVLTGNPVRAALVANDDASSSDRSARSVLVFGGSQGARFLNENVPSLLARVADTFDTKLHIVHQTGPAELETTTKRYAELGLEADTRAFIEDMGSAYADAELVVCRSGATTIAELRAAGLPAVLVPFPYAADDHQAANAKALVSDGAAIMVRKEAWSEETLAEHVVTLLSNDELVDMGRRAAEHARPQASRDVAELVLRAGRVLKDGEELS